MKKKYRTTFHSTAEANPVILVSGGKIGVQIELQPQDLLKAAGGEYADLLAK